MKKLPIYEIQADLLTHFRNERRLVIKAPTGSGKSTQVPQMLLDGAVTAQQQIVVLQPRRMAARMLARRVAQERQAALGGEVGYQVRFEHHVSARTRIRYVTEGILLREMLSNPELQGVSVLIFDEFHERHLYGDVTLARARMIQQQLRDDLSIIVMSATLDTALVSEYLGMCRTLETPGRMFPVDLHYRDRRIDPRKVPVWEQAAGAFAHWAAQQTAGDVLIFMPGAYEIRKTVDAVAHHRAARSFDVVALHGEMPAHQQDRAVQPGPRRKVVVSTNVAETSITIEGIRAVIDSGLARVACYDPHRGIDTLLIQKISQASADQRAGRAGRMAPGQCYRLWTAKEHAQRPLQEVPEIKRVDLAEILLVLKAAGIRDLEHFPWVEAPEKAAFERAFSLLADLGAVSQDGELTACGQQMVAFPLHPRQSRMLLAAQQYQCVAPVALMAALMQGRPLLIKSAGRQEKQAREAQLGQETLSDLFLHIRAWQYAQAQSFDRPACARLGIHAAAARRTGLLFERFMKIAGRLPGDDGRVEYKQVMDETAVRKCILTGFSDRLALRRDKGTLRCDLVHGRSGELARESVVRIHPLLVASEIKEIQHGRDRKLTVLLTQATAVEESWLHELYPEDMHEERRVEYDPMLKRVVCRHRCLFRDLLLECRDSDEVHEEEAAKALADEIRLGRLSLHRWNHAVETWITRVNCLAQWCPYWDIPEITDEARCTILQQLCLGARCAKDLKHRDVWPTVHSWLTPAQRDLVERHVPERVALPCGRRAGIRYETGKAPVLSATIQDLYDLKEPPRLADGHVKLLFEILAPNRRPVQITEDLTGFWRDHYPALKRQLQRRYHKHEWR